MLLQEPLLFPPFNFSVNRFPSHLIESPSVLRNKSIVTVQYSFRK